MTTKFSNYKFTRRQFLASVGAAAGAVAVSSMLPACASFLGQRPVKIGFVTPQTGPLAVFAEPDEFTLGQVRKLFAQGLTLNGRNHPLEIIVKDSQSNPNRASEVASELILKDKVDLVVATATPETTNPVADQCEANGMPCVTNDTPWQSHFFGRKGDPNVGFEWTYHFFFGFEEAAASFVDFWDKVETNRVVGALWPNDPDGHGWSDQNSGLPAVLSERNYELIDPGRWQVLTDDFTAQISAFKEAGVGVVTGVMIPPDFANFWSQAGQQGLTPKVVTVGKATEFPAAIAALGERGHGLSVETWWSPYHPFVSGLTSQTSAELAKAYTDETGKPWTMPLGFKHSLFEVAIDVLRRTEDIDDPASIRDAIKTTDYQSIVGPVNFQTGPVPNISTTKLVTGQWQINKDQLSLEIVDNTQLPEVPLTAEPVLVTV